MPAGGGAGESGLVSRTLHFDDNTLLPLLYGEHDRNLSRLESQLDVDLAARGNEVTITGFSLPVDAAEAALDVLWARLQKGMAVESADVDAAARMAQQAEAADAAAGAPPGGRDLDTLHSGDLTLVTRKKHITPRSGRQAAYVRALLNHDLTFGLGPAGTGKTYLAVATAVAMKVQGRIDRIVLSRPAVEAGERLGFLPGTMEEKVDPYLRPLYDALDDMLPGDMLTSMIKRREIEIAPLAFMRGRTLSSAFVILDEAQNTTATQMKMFLTRLGEGSRMAVTGDLSQVDLPRNERSGLRDAVDVLKNVPKIGFTQFTEVDVVRHPLVTRIVRAYQEALEDGPREADLFDGK
jgi:phosphate starvation-inducible PhoH-like protein